MESSLKERFKSEPALNKSHVPNRVHKRSFDVGADRPVPNSVGKLKLSSEMRQRLEQVTAGHSVRSVASNKSEMSEHQPTKIDDARKMMLEQQLGGSHMFSVRTQIQRMEASKIQKPFMPLPSVSIFLLLKTKLNDLYLSDLDTGTTSTCKASNLNTPSTPDAAP